MRREIEVTVTNEKLIVELADGRSITTPLEWYPRLLHGSPAERQNWQLLGEGYAIEWPDLGGRPSMTLNLPFSAIVYIPPRFTKRSRVTVILGLGKK